MSYHRIILLAFLSLFSSPIFPFTLSEAISLVASHPAILLQSQREGESQATAKDARQLPPSSISLESEDFAGGLSGFSQSQTTLSYRAPLPNKILRQARANTAAIEVEASRQATRRLQWEVEADVQKAFHQQLVRQELETVANTAALLASEALAAVVERVQSGVAPEQEKILAGVEFQRAEAERQRLAGETQVGRLELARLLGQPDLPAENCLGTLTPDLTLPPLAELEKQIGSVHPDLLTIDLDAKRNQVLKQQLRAENRPSWSVVGGVRSYQETGKQAMVLAIEAELPSRNQNRGAIEAKQRAETNAAKFREVRKMEFLQFLRQEAATFNKASQHARYLRDIVFPQASQLQEMAMESYRLGRSDLLTLLNARKASLECHREYLLTLLELYLAVDSIERLCGLCLVGLHH